MAARQASRNSLDRQQTSESASTPQPTTRGANAMTPQNLAQQPSTPFAKLKELVALYADEVTRNPIFQRPSKQRGQWAKLYTEARHTRAMQAIRGAIKLPDPST